ncbi:hypothetical protein BDZ89DRAFT_757304 [Hymenopellis radicata]|nr:hypothetical protein BDZ89DRAFT_757304 [Hymenopellis radicata]
MSSASAQPTGPGAAPSALKAVPQATSSSGELILIVAAQSVQEYADPPSTIAHVQNALTTTPPPDPIPLLCGLVAACPIFSRRADTLAARHGARHMRPCQPSGTLWVQNMSSGHWTRAAATDQLLPAIYEYRVPPGPLLRLSKFSVRHNKSQTSATGLPDNMRRAVAARDQHCWISGAPHDTELTTNSHVCPKRMGDAMASHIYNEFCGVTANLSIYNPIFGLLLISTLDRIFDVYKLGLRRVGQNPDVYEAHLFKNSHIDHLTPGGGYSAVAGAGPLLHGHQVHPPQPQTTDPVPPPGLFRWHYMQCVLRRFGTDDYKGLPNIKHHELPFRSADDEDDQFEDDGSFDWPSAVFDRGRMEARVEAEQAEQRDRVVRWIAR